MQRLALIDANAVFFTAYHAPGVMLTGPNGTPTTAVYGFTKTILAVMREFQPSHCLVAWDVARHTTFRRQLYPAYKSARDKGEPAEDIQPQMKWCKRLLESLGLASCRKQGFEADDVIASAANYWAGDVDETIIVGMDKDLYQLLDGDNRVWLWNPRTKERVSEAAWSLGTGLSPREWIEVQMLMGDPTDNIPGVKGIGAKKASAMISQYGDADTVADNVHLLSESQQRNFEACDLDLMRQLVTLRKDVPLRCTLDDLSTEFYSTKSAARLFRALGFRSLIRDG